MNRLKASLLALVVVAATIITPATATAQPTPTVAASRITCPGTNTNACKNVQVSWLSQAGVYVTDYSGTGHYINPMFSYTGQPYRFLLYAGWCMWHEKYSAIHGTLLSSYLWRNPYGPTKYILPTWAEVNNLIMVPCSS